MKLDRDLIALLVGGLHKKYSTLFLTKDLAQADDLAQETFVRVYRSLPSYDPARPFGPWLRKIAWNCGLTVRRDGNAGVPRVAEGDAPDPYVVDTPVTITVEALLGGAAFVAVNFAFISLAYLSATAFSTRSMNRNGKPVAVSGEGAETCAVAWTDTMSAVSVSPSDRISSAVRRVRNIFRRSVSRFGRRPGLSSRT